MVAGGEAFSLSYNGWGMAASAGGVEAATIQLRRHRRESIVLAFRPTIFDGHVPALDVAGFGQTLAEYRHQRRTRPGQTGTEIPDNRPRLLRARRERPGRYRAAGESDEFAAFQCPVPTLLPIERIAQLNMAGDYCAAVFRLGL